MMFTGIAASGETIAYRDGKRYLGSCHLFRRLCRSFPTGCSWSPETR